jgi:primosomal replication protein N
MVERGALRYTPAGIPALNFKLGHVSEQVEAGSRWRVQCEIPCLALAETAVAASRLENGCHLRVEGFLAQRSRMSVQLVLHVDKCENLA